MSDNADWCRMPLTHAEHAAQRDRVCVLTHAVRWIECAEVIMRWSVDSMPANDILLNVDSAAPHHMMLPTVQLAYP